MTWWIHGKYMIHINGEYAHFSWKSTAARWWLEDIIPLGVPGYGRLPVTVVPKWADTTR